MRITLVFTLDAKGFQIVRFFVYRKCGKLYDLKLLCNCPSIRVRLVCPNQYFDLQKKCKHR